MVYVENVESCALEDASVDKTILLHGKKGDKIAIDYLMNKYEGIVRKKANTYFLVGSDREDVVQEGLIGLYKAICDYDENKRSSFRSFAELCITRQIITSIKTATRLKHTPLNGYISIYMPVQEESDQALIDIIEYFEADQPQDSLVMKENMLHVQTELMKVLTGLEWNVLRHYLDGFTYEEIATQIGRSEKSIDNALQRIKRKVGQLINENILEYDLI